MPKHFTRHYLLGNPIDRLTIYKAVENKQKAAKLVNGDLVTLDYSNAKTTGRIKITNTNPEAVAKYCYVSTDDLENLYALISGKAIAADVPLTLLKRDANKLRKRGLL